jgi:hypothetical protein
LDARAADQISWVCQWSVSGIGGDVVLTTFGAVR